MIRSRVRGDARKSGQSVWLIVYSDIMTNLMLFFLVLYASTRFTADEARQVAEAMAKTFVSVEERQKIKQAAASEHETVQALRGLSRELSKLGVKMTEEPGGMTLQLPVADFFDSGRAELKAPMQALLDLIGPPLRKYPRSIIVEGHTDDRPVGAGLPYRSNWELSFARAQSVMDYMVSSVGIGPEKLVAIGKGAYSPVVPNDSPMNRGRNRRTEIKLRSEAVPP